MNKTKSEMTTEYSQMTSLGSDVAIPSSSCDVVAVKKVTSATMDQARKERWDECLHAMKEDLTVWSVLTFI